jgi:hypothetical protein
MTGYPVAGPLVFQLGLDFTTDRHRVHAARVESTAARRMERARHFAWQDDFVMRIVRMTGQGVAQ